MDRAGALAPIRRIVSHTPSDSEVVASCRAIYIETTGDVTVDTEGGSMNVTIPGLLGGMWHPIRATRIYATGTAAGTVLLGY